MRSLSCACLLLLGACATDSGHSTSSMSDGSAVHTVRCEDSWDGCYRKANRICGDGGFDEVDRSAASTLDSAGRLERMHTVEGAIEEHRYSENARETVFARLIAISCKQPR
jgi:hypothetical protein